MTPFAWTQLCCEGCWAERHPGREPYRLDVHIPETCVFCGEPTTSGIYVRLYPNEVAKQEEPLVDPAAIPTRALVREIVSQRPRRLFQQCEFCGSPCQGFACAAHRDLLASDPHYAMEGAA